MKITLQIDDAHAPTLIQLLATLIAKTEETPADPAPGHPELPLAGIDAADPLKVVMDDEIQDKRPRIAPVVTGVYRARNGREMHAVNKSEASGRVKTLVHGDPCLPFHYQPDGVPCGGGLREWDLVEVITEPVF